MGCGASGGASAKHSNVNKFDTAPGHKSTAREREAEAAHPSSSPILHAVPVYFDWSPCEFDVPMPEELKAFGISEDVFYGFIYKLNFELLEPFAEKWKERAGASVTKSVLQTSVKKGAEALGNFAVPVPAKVALGAMEKVAEAARAEARKKEWDETAVKPLEAYLTDCNKKVEQMGAKFRLHYCEAPLTPIDKGELDAKRKKAQAALTASKVSDKMEGAENLKLKEFSAAFNEKVGCIEAQVDKVESKVEDAKDKVGEKVAEAVPAEAIIQLSTKVPCVMFAPCS